MSPELAGRFFTTSDIWEAPVNTSGLCYAYPLSRVRLFVTPWAHQVFCPWGFSRQEYWSGLPCPPPGEFFQPRDRTQVSHIAGKFFTIWSSRKPKNIGVGGLSLFQGSSLPMNQTRVSCIAHGFYTNWVPREADLYTIINVFAHNWILL